MRPQGLLRWIIRILCLGLVCLLAFLLVRYQRGERAHEAHIAQLRKEAERYETRLMEIRKELDSAKAAIGAANRSGAIMIAFQPQSAADLERISAQAETYGFTPAIVLDADAEHVESILRAAASKDYEIVLTGDPSGANMPERTSALWEKLGGGDAGSDTGVFLLREHYENEDTLQLVEDAGFDGCISYFSHADFAAAHPSFVMMHYSYLRSDAFSVQTRLRKLSDSEEELMFVFDLTAQELSSEAVDRFLSVICDYAKENGTEILTVAQTVEAIRQNRMNTASGQAAYDRLVAERQTEINELQTKLNEIYSRWKEEDAA